MSQSDQAAFLRQYLAFCANPLRGEDELLDELNALAALPFVQSLNFYSPSILMVGTSSIIIAGEKHRHNVGEFIFFIIRRRLGRIWETGFRFLNVTYPPSVDGGKGHFDCMHPHILTERVEKYPLIRVPTGKLCISRGQFGVYQYIRKGEIHFAMSRLWDILHTYGTGMPYADVSNWPKVPGENT